VSWRSAELGRIHTDSRKGIVPESFFTEGGFHYTVDRADFDNIILNGWTLEETPRGLLIKPADPFNVPKLFEAEFVRVIKTHNTTTREYARVSHGDVKCMSFLVAARLWLYAALEFREILYVMFGPTGPPRIVTIAGNPIDGGADIIGMTLKGSRHSIFYGPTLAPGTPYLFPASGNKLGVIHSETDLLREGGDS